MRTFASEAIGGSEPGVDVEVGGGTAQVGIFGDDRVEGGAAHLEEDGGVVRIELVAADRVEECRFEATAINR